jgi:hypothetical protein
LRIFIGCSKAFYHRIPPIKAQLESAGHQITLPNSYDAPEREAEMKSIGASEHAHWKAEMLRSADKKISACDAILVLNFTKNDIPNYIGGATFLEVYKAFELDRLIYFYHPLPDGILRDELLAMQPVIIHEDLGRVDSPK